LQSANQNIPLTTTVKIHIAHRAIVAPRGSPTQKSQPRFFFGVPVIDPELPNKTANG
jgi:hypothetical protein